MPGQPRRRRQRIGFVDSDSSRRGVLGATVDGLPIIATRRRTAVTVDLFLLDAGATPAAGEAAEARRVALLSRAERARMERFKHPADGRLFAFFRAGMRLLLADRLGVAPEDVALAETATGKPFLAAPVPGPKLHFNLSHCGARAVLALTELGEIGVDIECKREFRSGPRLAERILSEREARDHRAIPVGEQSSALLRAWTRKEAYLKATGEGLSRPLREVEVSLAAEAPARILRVSGSSKEAARWTLHHIDPAPDLIGAVACAADEAPIRLRMRHAMLEP